VNRLFQVIGVFAAIATAGSILAYPFVPDEWRPRMLYYAVASLALTVAMLALMIANVLERLLKGLVALERRIQQMAKDNQRQ
jgi:hypothetical protein